MVRGHIRRRAVVAAYVLIGILMASAAFFTAEWARSYLQRTYERGVIDSRNAILEVVDKSIRETGMLTVYLSDDAGDPFKVDLVIEAAHCDPQ